MPILVFLGLSVLDLGPMYVTDRQTSDVRQKHRLMLPPDGGGGITSKMYFPTVEPSRHFLLFMRSYYENMMRTVITNDSSRYVSRFTHQLVVFIHVFF